MLHDPRTQVIYDDARHYILTTKDTFDVITSDPIHPWVKGSARFIPRNNAPNREGGALPLFHSAYCWTLLQADGAVRRVFH